MNERLRWPDWLSALLVHRFSPRGSLISFTPLVMNSSNSPQSDSPERRHDLLVGVLAFRKSALRLVYLGFVGRSIK